MPTTPVVPAGPPAGHSDYGTSERLPAVPPDPSVPPTNTAAAPPPPDPGPAPSSARYPLFADTVRAAAPPVGPPPAGPPAYAGPAFQGVAPPTSRRSVMLWLIGVLVLAVIALVAGGLLLLAPSGDGDADDPKRGDRGDPRNNTGDSGGSASALTPADVAVPGSASASVDGDGNRVTFDADNMLDGDPRTSWRVAGDASGSVVTFTFGDPVTVTEVGLINGYAKTDPPHDWYAGNRRIEAVAWVFDDGTEVTQELGEVPDLQSVGVDAVETTTIELRIVEVSEPGTGPDARNYTAISDVAILGTD